ncbi:MAG: hypothetical protein E7331_03875 [Clostridiales bacterium]|nr:hypothetical protein [Clostridiales bacterium]
MKRIFSLLMILCLMLGVASAQEADHFTFSLNGVNVSFGMSGSELRPLFPDGLWEAWYEDDPEEGVLTLLGDNVQIDGLPVEEVTLQADRNNSSLQPRLTLVTAILPTGDNCILSFKNALAALTALYGQPDYDPFCEDCVRTYQQSGSLSATWTTDEVTINLTMNRMFYETLSLDYIYLLNYDPADLA